MSGPASRAALSTTRGLPFVTVGVGASAGGLQALEAFASSLPADAGIAIVIVTHQHPDHESSLPELLARRSALPVAIAASGVRLEPNRVYVGPPGKNIALIGGVLQLSEAVRDGTPQLPIDHFFRSLALDQEEQAVCIVLSGTGSDGTLGLRAVKSHGGMAIAQDEKSAHYTGMPRSAAATLLVDSVLPPGDMAAQLLTYARQRLKAAARRVESDAALSGEMRLIFRILQKRTGHDFSGYKTEAMTRRIERRMRIHGIAAAAEYVTLLDAHAHEVDLLLSELLINVTSFFRDQDVFVALESLLRKRRAKERGEGAPRVWVVGCSTGEEAYSIAMLLVEREAQGRRSGQVFASDVDPSVIEYARQGNYPMTVATDIGEERLARFFTPESSGYRVAPEVRELCVFATQSVIKDPPFTKLDIISCRNLLIYFNADTQRHVISLFHYALNPGGLLLLGTSETVGGFEHLFKPLDRKLKIYERLPHAAHEVPFLDWSAPWSLKGKPPAPTHSAGGRIARGSDTLLLERFAPPTLIVNTSGDIVYIHGRTGLYLEPAAGESQNNILHMARPGLHGVLKAALRQASRDEEEVVRSARVEDNGRRTQVHVIVRRIGEPEGLRGLLRVSFAPARSKGPAATVLQTRPPLNSDSELELELHHARGELQGSIEELQSSNEELKSMNEELQATNEELQSSNEELGSSKEELRSVNEELHTVNVELEGKLEELARANDDMANLLDSTDIATVFLDRNLCIKRFTDLAREVFHLIPGDVGRPIGDLASNLIYDRLIPDAQRVLETLRPHEVEAQTRGGKWRLVRIVPYHRARNVIDGVVINFLDIDRVKRAELLLAARTLAVNIVQTVREPLAVLDDTLAVVASNPAFLRALGLELSQVEQRPLFEIAAQLFEVPALKASLERLRAEGTPFEDVELVTGSPSDAPRRLLANARRLLGPLSVPGHILLTLSDATARAFSLRGDAPEAGK